MRCKQKDTKAANDKKQIYRSFCKVESSLPIFLRDWWLDAAVGPTHWDVALVVKGESVAAAMPYTIHSRKGFVFIGQPRLTQFTGPWIEPLKGGHAAVLSQQKKLMSHLIEQLPPFDYFQQCWHYSVKNWLPFYWNGFSQTTRYTYLIPLSKNYQVLDGFSSNMRNKAKKARKIVKVVEDLGVEVFYELNKMTFKRQGVKIPYSFDLVKKFDDVLASKGKRKIFFAVDGANNIHSALYLIWDDHSAYLHMAGENPDFRNSGAGILLIEFAIDFSIHLCLDFFDFEGSMMENLEIVRRSCGGVQTPYFKLEKSSFRGELLRSSKDLAKAVLGLGKK